MEIKTSGKITNIYMTQLKKEYGGQVDTYESKGEFAKKKWVVLDDEIKEALALYYHLKNHTQVKKAPTYRGMPICKICDKSAYQIMCEEWEKLSNSRPTGTDNSGLKKDRYP